MKEVGVGSHVDSLDSKSDQEKKKKHFAYSYKKVLVKKNPHRVQRDLCLSDKNNSYSLRNPLGVRGGCAVGSLFATSVQRKSLSKA